MTEEAEIHHIDLALEVIDNKLRRIAQDRERLMRRRSELVARKNGHNQLPLDGWDVT